MPPDNVNRSFSREPQLSSFYFGKEAGGMGGAVFREEGYGCTSYKVSGVALLQQLHSKRSKERALFPA